MAGFFNETQGRQFLKRSGGSVPGQIAFFGRVADRERYPAVVAAIVAKPELEVDSPRRRGQRPPGLGLEHEVVNREVPVLALFKVFAHHAALRLA
jgi:hypothetical protein